MGRRSAGQARRAPGGRRGYHHGNLRRALLDAALRLVETEGAQALTLRAAARLAGVSSAAPYRHFPDKQALLAAVAEEGFWALAAELRRAAGAHVADPLGRFRALGLGYVNFAASHPAHFRVMFGREIADRAAYPSLAAAARETFGLLVDAITDCQRVSLVCAADPQALALTAWSAVHGLSALLVDGQLASLYDKEPEKAAHTVTGALFFGLSPRA